MANVVDILVKANTAQAQGALNQFKGGLTNTIESLTGFNVGALAAGGIVAGLAGFMVSSTKKTQDYNIQMGKTADLIGVNVEEYSRLVQAGDDLRISQDSITTAMKMAIQNGFNPSIDNLAKLSDKISGMTDQVQIANVLQPIFGKQWNEIYPLLAKGGQAVRDNTAAIADNLVATQKSVEESRRLAANIDNLGDSATGFGNTVGNIVIPELSNFIDLMGKGVNTAILLYNWQNKINEVYEQNDKQVIKLSDGYDDYVKRTIQLYLATGKLTQAEYENLIQGRERLPIAKEFLSNLGMTSAFEYEAAKAADATAAAVARQTVSLDGGTQGYIRYGAASQAGTKASYDMVAAQDTLTTSMQTYSRQLLYNIASAELPSVQAKAALALQMGLINEKTQYAIEKTAQWAKELNDKQISIIEYNRLVNSLANAWDRIQSKSVTLTIDTVDNGGGNRRVGGPVGFDGYASGTSFIIPNGYHENFPIGPRGGASSGERVTVTPASQSSGSSESVALLRQIAAKRELDPAMLARLLRDAIQQVIH